MTSSSKVTTSEVMVGPVEDANGRWIECVCAERSRGLHGSPPQQGAMIASEHKARVPSGLGTQYNCEKNACTNMG